ncbi:MAG: uracil-DNA glycosylase [Candidatus Marinimicrobia bacterium]|jgi:DNA polymerase|nr:uracil-DNA glycosylase [Candidatus Neomarinimicrobiota bacterium]MBT4307111.1 uracil-DNA glycosylase [Candidatus Neomarinimicrobiota bacterium]MBT4452470.1 uracil-DNA glycosylase [Candidatus Neomarinimicrobiota bacterium]MBT5776836.1 uracil-DNA glycosylase [Candidatus Neomarinimicrobiota bacterium]MBT5995197.1 uracil-DNA glycosylase [Candidatus Neomarinimicrobiota bacterium]|tara:strand:- start:7119 stop:7802 length:684 start_codon:yes stop_codon:yes gene_type:complete
MGSVSPDAVSQYLKQTRELFGDELFLDQTPTSTKTEPKKMNPDLPSNIDGFYKQIHNCTRCALGDSRTEFVFGVGDPKASLVLVGEAPGEQEDLKGEPFVGRAGKLLDKILTAIDRSRQKDVYICNVLKCRPPKNRDPLPDEVAECEPYLIHQINLIQPKLIVALGRVAGKTLLNVDKPLKSMRGILHDYHGTPLIVTYHPAALLRNPNWKPETWKDFKWIRSIIDE